MMNIILSINDTFVEQAAALITSIHKNSKKDSSIRINILHSTVTQEHQDIMKKMVKGMENISELNFVDLSEFVNRDLFDKSLKNSAVTHASPEAYYRLYISNLFPQYNKALYLDTDLIVCEDLTELYNTNLENLYVGAVSEQKFFFKSVLVFNGKKIKAEDYLKNKLHIFNKTYFNSGVLLLNLEEMRKNNIHEKSFDFFVNNYPLAYCDQCVLNSVLNSKVKLLDRKYNVYSRFGYFSDTITNIIHFTGPNKPWNSCKKNESFEIYWKYFKLTPFYNEEKEKLYLMLKKSRQKKFFFQRHKFIKIVLGRHKYRIKIFHHTFSLAPKYVNFYRKSKQKFLSLLSTRK